MAVNFCIRQASFQTSLPSGPQPFDTFKILIIGAQCEISFIREKLYLLFSAEANKHVLHKLAYSASVSKPAIVEPGLSKAYLMGTSTYTNQSHSLQFRTPYHETIGILIHAGLSELQISNPRHINLLQGFSYQNSL